MTSSIELFSKYKNSSSVLIETGTYHGDGINCALSAGYDTVYSCDINSFFVQSAQKKYKDDVRGKVFVQNLDSYNFLKNILLNIKEPCVIFLDAHFWPEDPNDEKSGFKKDTVKDGLKPCPLVDELMVIKKHSIKTHTILIDDLQCFNTWVFEGLEIENVDSLIYSINPNYEKTTYANVGCYQVKM